MGELRFPGLATGIDTAAIIKQMMIINSRKLAKYQVQKTGYEEQNTTLDELRTKITALQSATSALSDADNMEIFNTTSSDNNVLTVAVSSEANSGSHSIEVNQLATTNTWIQDTSTFDYKTDYVLTNDDNGVFIYSYNNVERTITAAKNATTLEDFAGLINNDEGNPGVTASLLLQGGKYHLMLSGQETGEDYQITINESSTEVWKADSSFTLASDSTQNAGLTTKITELSQFTENAGLQGDEEIQITGTDRYTNAITQFDLAVNSNTTLAHLINAIEDAFGGNVKATLKDGAIVVTDTASGASSLSVSLAYNAGSGDTSLTTPTMAVDKEGDAISESLASLDSSYFIQTQTAQNSEITIDGYPSTTAVPEEQEMQVSGRANTGVFRLTYKGQTTADIDYNDPLTGAGSVQEALEALNNVNPGDITVGGQIFTTNNAIMTFTFSDTLGDVPMLLIDEGTLNGPGYGGITATETTKGINPWITRNSNSITDALTGITLNLHDVTEVDTPIKITINRNTGSVSKKIRTMVTAYNDLITELKSKTEYDTEAKKMGILSNDIAVSFIKFQTRDPFIGIADGFVDTIDSFVQASDIGLSIDGAGMMEFDTDEFNDAINDNFDDVLELLGATKSGNSSSTVIQFYNANDKYTTAGTYDVEVDIASNTITDVRTKLSSESTWRDNATWPNNLVSGNSDFDDDGNPLYPENGLQLTVDPSQSDGTYTATVNVKQGMAGALEDLLDEILKGDGRFDISKEILDDKITAMARRIENEENRLNNVETRLIQKYARLEKTLAMMQEQMAAVSMVSAATFGS
jgi:flagellar hook-associated protein 2